MDDWLSKIMQNDSFIKIQKKSHKCKYNLKTIKWNVKWKYLLMWWIKINYQINYHYYHYYLWSLVEHIYKNLHSFVNSFQLACICIFNPCFPWSLKKTKKQLALVHDLLILSFLLTISYLQNFNSKPMFLQNVMKDFSLSPIEQITPKNF
jgi:hypothetical protein